jgi:hypothetical protein
MRFNNNFDLGPFASLVSVIMSLYWFLPRHEYLKSFQQFPPRQRPGSFSVDQAMQMLMEQKTNN